MKSLDEFLTLATLSHKTFEAEKAKNLVLISENTLVDPKSQEKKFLDTFYNGVASRLSGASLRIPRKPKWTKGMTKEELHTRENVSFTPTFRLPSLTGVAPSPKPRRRTSSSPSPPLKRTSTYGDSSGKSSSALN